MNWEPAPWYNTHMTATIAFLLALTGVMLVLAIVSVFWAIRSGQYEDLEGPAQRILMDDDDELVPHRRDNSPKNTQ